MQVVDHVARVLIVVLAPLTGGGLALTVVVWSAGEIAIAGIGPTIVAALAPRHLRGAYAGASGMAWSAGEPVTFEPAVSSTR